MKIHAVTICINYADYLECILENRKHFANWTVATIESDQRTQSLCESAGLQWICSKYLATTDERYNAAFNKAGVINDLLDHIREDTWIIVLDADVYLPSRFLERLSGYELDQSRMYGLSGRRICETRSAFEVLRHHEPWETNVDRAATVYGYFNLFHSTAPFSRYPVVAWTGSARGHDDWYFYQSVPVEKRAVLPFTCLHVGPPAVNWLIELRKSTSPPISIPVRTRRILKP